MALTQSYSDQKVGFFSSLFDGLMRGIGQISASQSRVREIERLQAMSDEALNAKGLRREDIVRHVFRDVFWQ